MKKLTEVTRQDIFDLIYKGFKIDEPIEKMDYYEHTYFEDNWIDAHITYHGRLDEINFLKRLYPLDKLPSYDSRFSTAEKDIFQHTVANDDYENGWAFQYWVFNLQQGNEDKYLLNFICEMFNPTVRNDKEPWKEALDKINDLLKYDGYEIYEKSYISGRAVFGWREIVNTNEAVKQQIAHIQKDFDSDYINKQIQLMTSSIDSAPYIAIGKAKELLETCSKTILEQQGIAYTKDDTVNELVKKARKSIGLTPEDVNEKSKAKEIASHILGNLGALTQGLAELRNLYGDGHGKEIHSVSLPPRYAQLAVGAASTAVKFMLDTFTEKKDKNGNRDT